MICGDGVSEIQNTVCVFDVFDGLKFKGGVLEEGGVMDVGGRLFPLVLLAFADGKGVPSIGSFCDFGIDFSELFGVNGGFGDGSNLFSGRPDVG